MTLLEAIFKALPIIGAVSLGTLVGGLLLWVFIQSSTFLGKWAFSERSAHNSVRRNFAAETGKHIAEQANQHYWAIANAAGTLSVGLRGYIKDVEVHLYYPWSTQKDLEEQLASVAMRTSHDTFPSLVQLVWSLHNFQFTGSNDYLLPDRSAGLHLRRLYNSFRQSVSTRTNVNDGDFATSILRLCKSETYLTKDDKLDLEAILEAASMHPLKDEEMKKVRQSWEEWLASYLANVLTATEALEAFSRLLQQQLAELYRDWFRDRDASHELEPAERAVKDKTWFGMLDRPAYAALKLACEQPDFMMALRMSTTGVVPLVAGNASSPSKPLDGLIHSQSSGEPMRDVMRKGINSSLDPTSKFISPGNNPDETNPDKQKVKL
jgi:hypothetical protein